MKTTFKISIPKPCHENWSTMTPKEQGRFCNSCVKTVIDFTTKNSTEVQEYLLENQGQKICGHFYRKQLDTITIEIPETTFYQNLTPLHIFLLAVLFSMGNTLFSCTYTNGKKQKIDTVILIDTFTKKPTTKKSFIGDEKTIITPKLIKTPLSTTTVGITICDTNLKKDSTLTSTKINKLIEVPILVLGDMAVEDEVSITEEEVILGFICIEEPPRFKEDKHLTKVVSKTIFNKRITAFIKEKLNADTIQNLHLEKRTYNVYVKFTIDTLGNVTDIKVRAPHKILKKKIVKTIQQLPIFIPGKQRNKKVKTNYTLPITFVVE